VTSQYKKYQSEKITPPEKTWVWNMYGAGEENIGKEGKPEHLPVPKPAETRCLCVLTA
jgi:hypothetical protein